MTDPHRMNPDPHYRLYLGRDGHPVVICVQDFDYPDYDDSRFLSPDAWASKAEAESALRELSRLITLTEVVSLARSWPAHDCGGCQMRRAESCSRHIAMAVMANLGRVLS